MHQALFISFVYPDVEMFTRVKFKFAVAGSQTFSGGISMRTIPHRKASFRMKSAYIAETLQHGSGGTLGQYLHRVSACTHPISTWPAETLGSLYFTEISNTK